jgi:serpin B
MRKRLLSLIIGTTLIGLISGLTSCGRGIFSDEEIINPKEDYLSNSAIKKLNSLDDPNEFDFNVFKSEEYQSSLKKYNRFASKISNDLIQNYQKKTENIAVSPMSIFMASSLVAESTQAGTRNELLDLLGFDIDESRAFNKNLYDFSNFIKMKHDYDTGKDTLEALQDLNNSIWMGKNLEPIKDCLDNLAKYYYCEAFEADFKDKNSEANEAIRKYVYAKTRGLINKNFDIGKEALLALINTLYLKDVWGNDELRFLNDKYTFKNDDSTTKDCNLLQGKYFNGKAYENSDFSSFHTSTKNGFKMTFIKPNEGKKLDEVMTEENILAVSNGLKYITSNDQLKEIYHTRCLFPEFETAFDESITEVFENLGVKSLFTDNADFSAISPKFLYCSDVIHCAKLKVDKLGIEGAAVTAFIVGESAAPWDEYKNIYADFILDKSFGFVLSYRDAPVFIGRVNKI